MATLIKEFKGHSGSKVELIEDGGKLKVRKTGNVTRNHERLTALFKHHHKVPVIYDYRDDILIMEYIRGIDMSTYLKNNPPAELIRFLQRTLLDFYQKAKHNPGKDYTATYYAKLAWLDSANNRFPFSKEDLICKLPRYLPQTVYHGDLTLENLLFDGSEFIMIDAVTIEYDSIIFDIAKLRQDLRCHWFLRKDPAMLDVPLQAIEEALLKKFPKARDDYLLILMLLRVWLHCPDGSDDQLFLEREIIKLWK